MTEQLQRDEQLKGTKTMVDDLLAKKDFAGAARVLLEEQLNAVKKMMKKV